MHNGVEEAFKNDITEKGFKNILQNQNGIDFIYKDNERIFLAEIKPYDSDTTYRYNLRHAIGQIIHYCYEYTNPNKDIELQIVMGNVSPNYKVSESLRNFGEYIKKEQKITVIHIPYIKIKPFM